MSPGDVGAGAFERRKLADDDADEQQQQHAQPDRRIGDREREPRGGEQEVVEQERGDGCEHGADGAAYERRRDDRDEIDHRRIRDPRDVLQIRNHSRGEEQ
jgi:hypothetical protein